MKAKLFVLVAVLLLFAPFAVAQKGAGGPQQRGKVDHQRMRATDEQRHLFNTCTRAADRVRQQVREISRDAGQPTFNSDDARQHRERIHTELRTMEEEHARFMKGLSAEQREAMPEQIRALEQTRERLQLRLHELDEELGAANITSNRVRERSREVERAMKDWQKTHREMGSELGV